MDAGYSNIVGSTDSRDALDLYKGFEPDIVLLDLNMPYFDGFQVMKQLQELEKDEYAPVLVLTAMKEEDVRLKALGSGAKDFISKPFNRTEVLLRIQNMLEVRLLNRKVKEQNKLLENQNTILEEKVRDRTLELKETRLEVINRLGRAAEYRDNETGLHIIRMSKMSKILALASGIPDDEADIILHASPMHDIGKIGIPDRILLKPGKLNDEEWEIMKTHTTIGEKILEGHPSQLLKTAREIAVSHHEKWDGSGYPKGIEKDQIPVSGRICALADVFDALTSVRPYKAAWSVEDAVEEIRKGAGKSFDPDLVEILINEIPQMKQIKDQYREP